MNKYQDVNFYSAVMQKEIGVCPEEAKILDRRKEISGNINYRQFLGLLLGLTHYIIGGITSGYASVFLAQIGQNNSTEFSKISKTEASWVASIVVVPMAPSCLLCGFLLNKFRKKTILILITAIEITSWLTIYSSTTVNQVLMGRLLSGISSAMGSPIIPPFLGEISNPNLRGLYLSMVLLGLSLGLLIIHVLGAFYTWNTCALITAAILIAYFCLVLYLHETYAWYLRNDNITLTKHAFYWYRGKSPNAKQELIKLLSKQHENVSNNYTKQQMLSLCCSKLLLKPLGICTVAMLTMHFSGIKAIMFHSISIVSRVIPSLNQYTSTIIVDVIRIVMTCIGCVLINKFKVRVLFIISGVGSAVSHLFFSVFISFSNETNELFSVLALIALISYTIFSSIGIAPLTWVIAGEIFPLIVKGVASGVFCFLYFLTFFVIVKITPDLFEFMGISGGFLFFGGCTMLGTAVMYFILPETKNKTLKDIEDLFR